MKLTKRFFAFVLIVSMICSLFIGAQAMSFSDVDKTHPRYEAITELSGYGIINGYTDGTFQPDKAVTRAEMAKLIATLFTIDEASSGASPFPDVTADYWGLNYIIAVKNMGIIEGFPDGKFYPDTEVTYEQATAMIIRAFRYEQAALQEASKRNISKEADWSWGYRYMADQLGISKNAKMTISDPAPRGIIAQLLYNGLDVSPADVQDDNNGPSFQEGNSSLRDQFSYKAMRNVQVVSNPKITIDENDKIIKDGYIRVKDIDGHTYDMSVENNTEWYDYIGQYVNVSYEETKTELIAKSVTLLSETTKIELDKIKSVSANEIEYYTDEYYNRTSKLRFNRVDVVYNERALKAANKGDFVSLLSNAVTLNDGALSFFGDVSVSIEGEHAFINIKAYKSYMAKTAVGSDKNLYLDGKANPISMNVDTSEIVRKNNLTDKGNNIVSVSVPRLVNICESAPSSTIIGIPYVEYIVSNLTSGVPMAKTDGRSGPFFGTVSIGSSVLQITNSAAASKLQVNMTAQYFLDAKGNIAYVDSVSDGDKRFGFYNKYLGETNGEHKFQFYNPETGTTFVGTTKENSTEYTLLENVTDINNSDYGELLWVSLTGSKISSLKLAKNVTTADDSSLTENMSTNYVKGGTITRDNSYYTFSNNGSAKFSTSNPKIYITPKTGGTEVKYTSLTITNKATHDNKLAYEINKKNNKVITVVVADVFKGLHSNYRAYLVKSLGTTSGSGSDQYNTMSCYEFQSGDTKSITMLSSEVAATGLSEGDIFVYAKTSTTANVEIDSASSVYILVNADYAATQNNLSTIYQQLSTTSTSPYHNASVYQNGFRSYKIYETDEDHAVNNFSLSLPIWYNLNKLYLARTELTEGTLRDDLNTFVPGDAGLATSLSGAIGNWNGDSVVTAMKADGVNRLTECNISEATKVFVYDNSKNLGEKVEYKEFENDAEADAYLATLSNLSAGNPADAAGINTMAQRIPLMFTCFSNYSENVVAIYVIMR